MDGTLTKPNLDFARMYQRAGVDPKRDILRAINDDMSEEEAKHATRVIEEMEEEGRKTLQLMPGAVQVNKWLAAHEIRTALVTRNTCTTAQVLMELLRKEDESIPCMDPVISRESHAHLPPKPDPTALHEIAQHWNIQDTQELLMVGDSPVNDVAFGKAAGARTALLSSHTKSSASSNRHDADIHVNHLIELPRHIWNACFIDGPLGADKELHGKPAPEPSNSIAKAAVRGDLPYLQTLLSHEQLCEADKSGNTALIWAIEANQVDVVAFLLQKDVNVDTRGYLGATAVCRAARRGNVEILELLIEKGANLDIPNEKLQYPLHFAAFKENMEAVKILLEGGADMYALDRKGRIPAEDTKSEAIRNLILEAMKKNPCR